MDPDSRNWNMQDQDAIRAEFEATATIARLTSDRKALLAACEAVLDEHLRSMEELRETGESNFSLTAGTLSKLHDAVAKSTGKIRP